MSQSIPSSEPTKPLLRVLIVDDMQQVRTELHVLLQVSGEIEVIGEAANGEQAIQQARLLQPDVVVLDLEMPVMDGLQATSRIKQSCPGCRVVILSVHSTPEDIDQAYHAGADCFVQKGSSYLDLMQAIVNKQTEKEKK